MVADPGADVLRTLAEMINQDGVTVLRMTIVNFLTVRGAAS
jgi:hypothetical protein